MTQSAVSPEQLRVIRGEIARLLPDSVYTLYDTFHIPGVERHAKALAESRGLDVSLAQTIALLHDYARIQYGIIGKPHALTGAKLSRKFLQEVGLKMATIDLITNAIAVHNQKKKVHGYYAELIKDADALAHRDEANGIPEDVYEALRCQWAFEPPASFQVAEDLQPQKILQALLDAVADQLQVQTPDDITADWVHDTRVHIRKVRSLLWLYDDGQTRVSQTLAAIEKPLKKIFRHLEVSRESYILLQSLQGVKGLKALKKYLEDLLESERIRLYQWIKRTGQRDRVGDLEPLVAPFIKAIEGRPILLEDKFDDYTGAVAASDIKDVDSLHRVRIAGKRIKYLTALGLLTLGEEDTLLIRTLHDQLGTWHDREVNKALIEDLVDSGKLTLSEKQGIKLDHHFVQWKKKERKDLRTNLFHLKLRFR